MCEFINLRLKLKPSMMIFISHKKKRFNFKDFFIINDNNKVLKL